MEELTEAICEEYRKRALALSKENHQDIGARRELRLELQERCGIPEIWAVNIINGIHAKNYIAIIEYRKNNAFHKNSEEKRELLEWQAEKEEKRHIEKMMKEDEKNI